MVWRLSMLWIHEWINGENRDRKESESESCSVVSDSLQSHGLQNRWNSLGQNTGVGSLSLFQGIFPTQGLNPGLPHCRQILYQLSHKGSPRILEWVAYPFSSGSSRPRNWTGHFLDFALQVILYQLSYQGSPTGIGLRQNGKEGILEKGERGGQIHRPARCGVWNLKCFSYKLCPISEPHMFNSKMS